MKKIKIFLIVFTICTFAITSCNSEKGKRNTSIVIEFNRSEYDTGYKKPQQAELPYRCSLKRKEEKGILKIHIPNSVNYINKNLIDSYLNYINVERHQIQSIILPDNIKEISAWIFEDCSNLNFIYLPENLLQIGDCAFKGCKRLYLTEFPKELREIGNNAFEGCSNISDSIVNNGSS